MKNPWIVFGLFLCGLGTGVSDLARAQSVDEKPLICYADNTPQSYVNTVNTLYAHPETSLSQTHSDAIGLFRLGNRWTTTATNGSGLTQGEPTVLTWSYIRDAHNVSISGYAGENTSTSVLEARLNTIYGNFTTWHALFVQVFQRWSELTGITYIYEANDDGAGFPSSPGVRGVRGDIRIGGHTIDGNYGILAYNFYPNTGDMVFDTADSFFTNTSNNSLGFRNVIAHEHGHGLGLAHTCPVNQTKLMEPYVSANFDGPQFDDILGAQRGYGDLFEYNETVDTATALGTIASGTVVSEAQLSIAGDTDFFSFDTSANQLVTIRVTPPAMAAYLEGSQNGDGSCSSGTLFDPTTVHNLGIELRGTDGTTVLASANAQGAGAEEVLSDVLLSSAGTYYIRVFADASSNVQSYTLEVTASNNNADVCNCNAPGAIRGTEGDDVLDGTAGDDIICGLGGNDVIYGQEGNDCLDGGAGRDSLYGGPGNDILRGGDSNDTLRGEGGHDRIYGGSGHDKLYGNIGNDLLRGGPGNDLLVGGPGNDRLYGDAGLDTLQGNTGDDQLSGGSDDDACSGGGEAGDSVTQCEP